MRELVPAGEDAPMPGLPEAGEWLERYGDALYRYALARLRRSHDAEEAVQETLLAALRAREHYQGTAPPLTWLTGILKHKVVDRLRASARADATGASSDSDLDAWFDERGKWRLWPKRWADPAAAAERSEFWDVMERCLARLPARMAAAFTLRTVDDLPTEDVCANLAISSGNLWLLLHRARLQLVRCLELHWIGDKR